jgi:hypothetical protein
VHGKGLFATKHLREVQLGSYSSSLLWGDEAESVLEERRRSSGKRQRPDLVECVDVPAGHEARHEAGDIHPPYVLLTDRDHPAGLCRLNEAPSETLANTIINRNGTVTAVNVAEGDELLTWYGGSYWGRSVETGVRAKRHAQSLFQALVNCQSLVQTLIRTLTCKGLIA